MNKVLLAATATAMLLACGSSPRSPAVPTTREPARVESEPPPTGELVPGATWEVDGVLLRGAADLDGDGRTETIELVSRAARPDFARRESDPGPRIRVPVASCDPPRGADECPARLVAGRATLELEIPTGYFGGASVELIDIDRSDARKELLLTQRGGTSEDPWYEFRVVLYDGHRLLLRELWHSGGYNSGVAEVRGDGTLTLRYDECPDDSTVTYRLDGTALVETGRQVVRTGDPSECAACPYVYLLAGDRFVRQGEILRNLNRASLAATQSLPLAHATAPAGLLTVELREEKDETTFLDDVYLEVDGERVSPLECSAAPLAYCAAGGDHHVLHRGDSLRLTFATAVDVSAASPPRLYATGYYVP